jgi:phosphatidylethanolamine/phosphatidyl-N-methylethanolamine N-methyltransferase
MSKLSATFYNRFSFMYPIIELILKPQKILLVSEINSKPEGKLLEIGVGNGSHLGQYKNHKITGVDTSVAMLAIARKKCKQNMELFEMNGEALLFDNQLFDYVVLSHVIAVVDNPDQLLREAYRVMKPQGQLFILNHFTPNNFLRHIDSAFEIIAKLLYFKSVFRIESVHSIERFTLIKEVKFGVASYFKLLIYQK